MSDIIEALNEALSWVRNEWIGRGHVWSGEIGELVSACDHDHGITVREVKLIWKAMKDGEHVGSEGWSINHNLITVYPTIRREHNG